MPIITLIAAILVGLFTFFGFTDFSFPLFSIGMLAAGIAIFVGECLLYSLTLSPLATLEENTIPHLMRIVRRNFLSHMGNFLLFLFVFISIVGSSFLSVIQDPQLKHGLMLGWIVFFGFALDLLRNEWNHFTNLLNPSYLVRSISQMALHAVQNDEDEEVRNQLDNLTEICLRSIEKNKLALGTETVQTFPPIIHAFLGSAKSIAHSIQDVAKEEGKGKDQSSYMNFYLIPRLEMIFNRALDHGAEPICRHVVMAMGKIIMYCAQFDLSLVSFPVHFLTKFALTAQHHHVDEEALLTTSTLVEIAKRIISDIDITYAELEEPYRSIITGLDAIAKGTFKKRKEGSISLLIQPLEEIKSLFQTEKMAQHRDTPVILQEIDSLLEEYRVLEEVMSTLPSFSSETPKQEADADSE